MGYKSSFEAESALIQLERELQDAGKNIGVLETDMNQHRREILEMEIRKNNLREAIRKGRENIHRMESEARIAKTEFWRLRGANL